LEVGVKTPSPAAKIFRSGHVPTRRVASLPEDAHSLHLHPQLRARRALTVFWVCDAIATSAAITQRSRDVSADSIAPAGAPSMPLTMRRGEPNRRANVATARFIPLLLIGIIGYVSWVVTGPIAIDYLLDPAPSLLLPRRTGSATAILVIYYLLLLILLVTYGRLVYTIIVHPGTVPRGPQWYEQQRSKDEPRRRRNYRNDKDTLDDSSGESHVSRHKHRRSVPDAAFQVQNFWQKDVFICQYDGRPPFCSHCYNFKNDRVHHCSELDRCVYKMDHFCPWVGGIVSETSFKYFIQFTFYTALFCLHTLVFTAYYYAERRRRENGFINVHWILVLAFAALFFIFGAGMCGSSMQFAFENTTTIENLSRRSHVWYLAVHVPERVLQRYLAGGRGNLRLITYPRPEQEQLQILQQSGADVTPPPSTHDPANPSPDTNATQPPPLPHSETRTFAILESKPGENPFDIGYFNNFREVLGDTIWDWLLPIRPSPCTYHDSHEGMYRTGPVVQRLREEAGIVDEQVERRHSRRRRRRRRSSAARSGEKGAERV
jgi:palmitoyltransferase